MTQAASAVLDHGHRVFGLTRILAIVSPDNAGSIRVLQRCGFQITGSHMATGDDPRYPPCEEVNLILV